MSEGGFGFPFGGDPEDLLRGLREFAEQQAESVQEAQREQYATLTLNTAVELTAAALSQVDVQGSAEEQSIAMRDAMRVLFPEAEARDGVQESREREVLRDDQAGDAERAADADCDRQRSPGVGACDLVARQAR